MRISDWSSDVCSSDLNRWIGIAIRDYEPDVVVDIGDNADFPSVSAWAAPGSKGKEGQRLQRDIDAANEAEELLAEGMGGFKPKRKVRLRGNHNNRLERYLEARTAVRRGGQAGVSRGRIWWPPKH